MQNIPLFTAANGLASLVLREIPFSGRAYIMIRSIWNGRGEALVRECADFCRMAGAKEIYASMELEDLPLAHAYDMVELQCRREDLPDCEPVDVEPLTARWAEEWLEVYNRAFLPIAGAAAYDRREVSRLIKDGTGVLVRRDGHCAAIAETRRDGLAAIAVLPACRGLGTPLALTLLKRMEPAVLTVRTASTNGPALAMYRRIGFQEQRTVSRWWRAETEREGE